MFIYTFNPYSWDDPIELALPDCREDVLTIEINWRDNPWFPDSLNAERLEAKATMSDEEYLRIWEGIPYENAERAVMSRAGVAQAMERQASRDGGIVVGVDVARFGADQTVMIKREGLQVVGIKKFSKMDTQECGETRGGLCKRRAYRDRRYRRWRWRDRPAQGNGL